MNFLFTLQNGNDRVNPGRIDGYVGAMSSDVSADMAHVLSVLGIPQVSYGASSSVFTDSQRFPYFLRTVPGDAKLARAIVAFLNKSVLPDISIVLLTVVVSVQKFLSCNFL